MATISNTPRPGFIYDSTDGVWYPIGTGTHSHSEIAKTIVDAKGDLIVGTAADTVARQAVGTDGQMLYADSTQTNGIKWADAPASGSMTLLSTTTLSGTSTTISSISGSYKDLYVTIAGITYSAASRIKLRVNNDSTLSYFLYSTKSATLGSTWGSQIDFMQYQQPASNTANFIALTINNYASTTQLKGLSYTGTYYDDAAISQRAFWGSGGLSNTAAVTSLAFYSDTGNFSAGEIKVYGVN